MRMNENNVVTHKWTDAGLGQAPFSVVSCISLPSPSLAERNPSGFQNANNAAHSDARRFGVRLGSCDFCGNGIMNNMVVRDAEGKHFVVGCDCAQASGDDKVMTEAENIERLRKRSMAQQRRDAMWEKKRQEREAKLEAERESNGGLTDWEVEQKEIEDRKNAKCNARLEVVGHITEKLFAKGTDFHKSLGNQLIEGNLSWRQAHCVCKAVVGSTGRRNKANAEEWDAIEELCVKGAE